MSVAALPMVLDRERIAAVCRARGLRKLSLFGSVPRADFDPQHSDVDVHAECRPDVPPGLKFFGYGDERADIVGRRVAFNTEGGLSPHFREEAIRKALPVYEQAFSASLANRAPSGGVDSANGRRHFKHSQPRRDHSLDAPRRRQPRQRRQPTGWKHCPTFV